MPRVSHNRFYMYRICIIQDVHARLDSNRSKGFIFAFDEGFLLEFSFRKNCLICSVDVILLISSALFMSNKLW